MRCVATQFPKPLHIQGGTKREQSVWWRLWQPRWPEPPALCEGYGASGQLSFCFWQDRMTAKNENQYTWATEPRMRRFQAGTGSNPSPLRLVYTRCFSSRTTLKSGDHGTLACRPRKTSNGSGTTPSRAEAAPSGPAQKRDNKTHRPVKLPSGGLLDRGPPSSYVTKVGQVRSLRGSGWPPTNGIAWIRARKRRAFSCKPGGRSGGRVLSKEPVQLYGYARRGLPAIALEDLWCLRSAGNIPITTFMRGAAKSLLHVRRVCRKLLFSKRRLLGLMLQSAPEAGKRRQRPLQSRGCSGRATGMTGPERTSNVIDIVALQILESSHCRSQ